MTELGANVRNEQSQTLPIRPRESVRDLSAQGVHKIIVGVDFGTTYTGVSWVETSGSHLKTLEDVQVIRDWPGPGREADFAWKTPSRIAYGNENGDKKDTWGFEVKPGAKGYTWMKLLLDPVLASKYDDPSLKASEGRGVLKKPQSKSAVDLCGDYLGHVAVFAYEELKKKISPEILAPSPLEFWFTVPAVWSDKAKADTLYAADRAAKNAGVFDGATVSTFLIAEPEAAAVATISHLSEGGSRLHIKPNDGVMVCDCGGGTVDITSYQVLALEPKLEFREIVAGSGGKCGSTYIDRSFIEWMEKTFGQAYKSVIWEKRAPASRFMKEFEGHKRDFGKSTDPSRYYEMELSMPRAADSKHYDSEQTMVKLYEAEMKRFFDPVVARILNLISDQLNAEVRDTGTISIKMIMMVGGFGDSRYLNNKVRTWCSANLTGIRVICPNYPQAAIVRGAALSGLLNLQPRSRRARRHYGFGINFPFDPAKHREDQRYFDEWQEQDLAKGCIGWNLKKGDVVTESTKLIRSMLWPIYVDSLGSGPGERIFYQKVYCCDADEAPPHEYDASAKELATVKIDFSGVDLSDFPQKERNGRQMRGITVDLHIQFGSRRGVLAFTSFIKGKESGSVAVSFDGENSGNGIQGLQNDLTESTTSCVLQ